MRWYARGALALAMLLIVAACGDDDGGLITTTSSTAATTTTEAVETTTTAPPETTTTTEATGAVSSLEDVRSAVVHITAKGTLEQPAVGEVSSEWTGSGFFIDESGLAVTNNHVVTGAAILQVFLEGETGPRNARVLGVSECSDLAVIDVDGDGFPFLEWFDEPVTPGLEIYAAGFPLAEDYTLLDGIVSKEDADGETYWGSIDAVIEHTADTLPGNSGGPVVTRDGLVVGVHYRGRETGQHFAIGPDVAIPVVEVLSGGQNVDSVGVNGEAFVGEGFSGIWVYSVEAGSPADQTGVRAGDVVTRLAGLEMAADGTMADYCDVLRSHDREDVLDIEVFRFGTAEVLRGQLNGRELELVTSFADELGDEVTDTGAAYSGYWEISDDSGAIIVEVPLEWADVRGLPWGTADETFGPGLSASTDLDAWASSWGTPGVFIGASAVLGLTVDELLDGEDFSNACTYVDRFDYDDGVYFGAFDFWENCGDAGSDFLVVAAEPEDGSFIVLVELGTVTDADLEAADRILNTFLVVGEL